MTKARVIYGRTMNRIKNALEANEDMNITCVNLVKAEDETICQRTLNDMKKYLAFDKKHAGYGKKMIEVMENSINVAEAEMKEWNELLNN